MPWRNEVGAAARRPAGRSCGAIWSRPRSSCSTPAATTTPRSTTSPPRPGSGDGRSSGTSAARRTPSRPITRRRSPGSPTCSRRRIPPSPWSCSSCGPARPCSTSTPTIPPCPCARFALTHRVPALRDRESASVDHYRRLFTRHLRQRLAEQPDGELRAAVIGAAVVAAHNVALRSWLAAGAPADGYDACRERFRRVADLLPVDEPAHPGAAPDGRDPPPGAGRRPPGTQHVLTGWRRRRPLRDGP